MLPVSRVIGHREWSPGRKSDPVYDMNWRRAGVAGIQPKTTAPRGLFMHLTEAEEKTILEAAQSVLFGKAGVRNPGQMALAVSGISNDIAVLRTELKALAARPAPQSGQVDPAPIVAAIVDAIADTGLAQHVVDALAARLAVKPPAD